MSQKYTLKPEPDEQRKAASFLAMVLLVLLASAGDADSDGFCRLLLVMLSCACDAGSAGSAGDAGFSWCCW